MVSIFFAENFFMVVAVIAFKTLPTSAKTSFKSEFAEASPELAAGTLTTSGLSSTRTVLAVVVEDEEEIAPCLSLAAFGVPPLGGVCAFLVGHSLAPWPLPPHTKHLSFFSKPSQECLKGHFAARVHPLAVRPKKQH